MRPSPPAEVSRPTRRRLLVLAGFLLLLYIVVPRLGSFSDSLAVARQANILFLVAALLATVLTYLAAAGIYWCLALRPLRYRPTLAVQAASAFTNRLLPGGLGALTLYVQYLRRTGHTFSQAVAVAGSNNLLGITGHVVILTAVLLFTKDSYPAQLNLPTAHTIWLVAAGMTAILAANLLVFRRLRQHAYKITKEVIGNVGLYRRRPAHFWGAALLSCLVTVLHVTILYCCVRGVGLEVSVTHVFLVFTLGIVVGTATPTPGGLVGAEAGLTGGLIAYGAPADASLAAALLYRLLTYWLPLLPGFIVFVKVRHLYSRI